MKEKDLKAELKSAMKAKDAEKCNAIRMVLGEIPRLNKKKGERVTEGEINKIIAKLVKSEKDTLSKAGIDESKSEYLTVLTSYLPKMMTKEEITAWILDNLDMNDYNVPIQAMKDVMKSLKGKADGNLVKEVLTEGK